MDQIHCAGLSDDDDGVQQVNERGTLGRVETAVREWRRDGWRRRGHIMRGE